MDVGEIGAAGAGSGEGTLGDIDGEQVVAATGELAGEDTDGAADFEGVAVALAGEMGEGVLIFAGFVLAGFEVPRVGGGGVDVFEVGRGKGSAGGRVGLRVWRDRGKLAPEAAFGAVGAEMGLAEGGASDVGEGLVGSGLAEVHGEIAEDAPERVGVKEAVGADPSDDALHERGGDALDGDTRHVGTRDQALGGELVWTLTRRESKAGFGEGGGAFNPEGGFLRGEGDLTKAGDLIGIFGAVSRL